MKKYIVLSVNDNPDYLYYVPLTCWAWSKFGWEPILMYNGKLSALADVWQMSGVPAVEVYKVENIEGYRSDTITQISRLYAVCGIFSEWDYLMTGDIDLIPLSDYWKPDENKRTVWGHDLTGYGHYPICFIGMNSKNWIEVMNLKDGIGHPYQHNLFIKRDLDTLPQAKDTDFYKYWFSDQDLITERLKPFNPTIINRGQYPNGYARGRVDRGAWTMNHSEFIDCHMFQQLYFKQNQDKFDKTMELLTSIWPEEDFGWFLSYTKEFQKLTGHS